MKLVTCRFCKGWGHIARNCSTLKSVNRKCMDVPALKQAWGKQKSKYLGKTLDLAAVKGMVGRKRLHSMIVNNEDESTYF